MAVHRCAHSAGCRTEGRALSDEQEEVLEEIRIGLTRPQKELPTRLFYDERGSELFEAITRLPEYYLTRAEQALIRGHVPEWIAEQRPRSMMELGAGSATKTRLFLDAMVAHGGGVTYVPVDISAEFLERTASRLRGEYPRLNVTPIAAGFARSLELTASLARPLLITFLGSTIGNFTTPEAIDLLTRVRAAMRDGDRFILGVDLRKDASILEAAYNDDQGATAKFNLNILRVINHRFGADFDLEHFRHRAFYYNREHRMEMHLVSERPQAVRVPGVGVVEFRDGETIRTEISSKYDRQSVGEMFDAARLDLLDWREGTDGMFALSLATTGRMLD